MRTIRPGTLATLLTIVILSFAPTAQASHGGSFTDGPIEECVDETGNPPVFGPMGCVWDGEGHLVTRAQSPEAEMQGFRNAFAAFAVVWVLLVVGSVAWVLSTAKTQGDPVGTALLGALIGGPLFVLLYGTNANIVQRGRAVYRRAGRISDDGADPRAPSATPTTRLRELDQLRDAGAISAEEHDEGRRRILEEI